MLIKLHGTRGSIPQPADTSKYGGNTSCYEVLTDDMQIILDTGTGFQNVPLDTKRTSIILYSHFHHDHIQGLPFNGSVFAHQEIFFCPVLWSIEAFLETPFKHIFRVDIFPLIS